MEIEEWKLKQKELEEHRKEVKIQMDELEKAKKSQILDKLSEIDVKVYKTLKSKEEDLIIWREIENLKW